LRPALPGWIAMAVDRHRGTNCRDGTKRQAHACLQYAFTALDHVMTDGFELKCTDYRVRSASIGHSSSGDVFRCTLSPVSEDVLESLDAAARAHETIRLIFPKEPLVLERIEVKRLEPGCVRIVGRIVSP
jgi:hypothetical protein